MAHKKSNPYIGSDFEDFLRSNVRLAAALTHVKKYIKRSRRAHGHSTSARGLRDTEHSGAIVGNFLRMDCLALAIFFGGLVQASELPPIPAFRDFPAEPTANTQRVAIDLTSHPSARLFRTRVKRAAKQRPNFAGHYVVAEWGCGSMCSDLFVVDLNTGKVLSVAGSARPLQFTEYLRYQKDSRLLIADPPCLPGQSCLTRNNAKSVLSYFTIESDGLHLIAKIHCRRVGIAQCRENRATP